MDNMYFPLALEAARRAGDHLAALRDRTVISSEGYDIKMSADREAESILMDCLRPSGLPVLSEETPTEMDRESGPYWIIDPLDGTYNFSKGMDDLCCTSVALWDGGRPLLGVVNKFLGGELFAGFATGQTTVNGRPVRCSDIDRVSAASCATGFSVKGDHSPSGVAENIRLFSTFKKIRMLGAAALMSSYVGAGRIDVYFELDILLWDIAAGAALVEAGGGIVDYHVKDDHRCDIFCFANHKLREDFYRQAGRPAWLP